MITKFSLLDHNKHKQNLLNLIDSIPNLSSNIELGEQVSKSDWYLNSSYPRKYWDYFFNILAPWFDHMENKYGHKISKMQIANYWFQQYLDSDYHGWHTHPNSNFSNVYFLELPETNMTTEFKDHKPISVKEGDIITFPAYLLHRSPINSSGKRKTVIVFNSNMCIN
jgi:hypothetical protein